jgi:hypothetical protein
VCMYVYICIYNIFFIQFYVGGQLCWLHGVAMNTCVQVSLLNTDLDSSSTYPEVIQQDRMVGLLLVLWRTSILIPIVAVLIYILTNSV